MPDSNSGKSVSSRGTVIVQGAAIAILIAILYAGIVVEMAWDWWSTPALSQGMLIPPLTFLVVWITRDTLFEQPAVPSAIGYWVTAAACGLLVFGRLAAEYFLQRMSFVILLAGLALTFWGRRRFRPLAFPFLLLSTMVPLPSIVYSSFAVPLQLLASGAASSIARSFGVAVYQDGNVIHLAGISLGVEEACSGLSSLSALVVASLVLGFLLRGSVLQRGFLLGLAFPAAIGINVLRIAGSAILADYDQQFARGFYHLFSGWLIFALGALALVAAMKLMLLISPGDVE